MGASEWLRTHEVASILNMSSKQVRELLRDRALPGFRQGGIWFVPRVSLNAYLERMRRKADENLGNEPAYPQA
ncbi:MAG: helix-turn-helix domain-containing protein [Planctomycetota bacterium]|nr:helix-turn-helix domain-containing protein [Planctomycetota bacterium]